MRDVHVTFAPAAVGRCGPSTASISTSRPGEVLALVGESGCGKTTLIRSIIGLEPTAGTITFDGAGWSAEARARASLRRSVQMIFQDPTGALNPRATIYEAVAEGIRIHGLDGPEPELVADALARRPGCGRPSGTWRASRTRCRADNANVC